VASCFRSYRVLTLHLEMAATDWDRVRVDQPNQNESWVPEVAEALFWADGETPIRVTVRRKENQISRFPRRSSEGQLENRH
jgi:hypothetical protein